MKTKEAWNGLLDDIKIMGHLTNVRQKKDILDKLDILRLVLVDYEEMKKEIIERQETENSLTQWVADLTTELEELKRDVKRYFELIWIFKNAMGACEEDSKPYLDEYTLLKNKLMKVGNEDE